VYVLSSVCIGNHPDKVSEEYSPWVIMTFESHIVVSYIVYTQWTHTGDVIHCTSACSPFSFQYTRTDCDEIWYWESVQSCYELNSGSCLNTFMFPLHETEEFYQSSKKLHVIQNIVLE
jgi:hypothetical protein